MNADTLKGYSDDRLAEELDRARHAIAVCETLGLDRSNTRNWKKYRRAVVAEIDRRYPADDTITDAELQSELAYIDCQHVPAPRVVPALGSPLPTCAKCGAVYMPDDDSE
jgi:hypothetical protein